MSSQKMENVVIQVGRGGKLRGRERLERGVGKQRGGLHGGGGGLGS